MKNNRILNLAASLCNFLKVVAIAFAVAATVMLVYWHINASFFGFITVPQPEEGFKIVIESATLTMKYGQLTAHDGAAESVLPPQRIKADAVYLLYLQLIGLTILWILILRQLKHIVTSVQGLQTFGGRNSRAFRKTGWYCFYIFLMSAFEWLRTDNAYFFALYLDAIPLLFMLISFILAEIFEEGNKLYEAEQLTI